MAKGLKNLILLEAKVKRKLEKVRRKIRETDNGGSPSSEDSELEDFKPKVKRVAVSSSSDEGEGDSDVGGAGVGGAEVAVKNDGVKQEVPGDFFCTECGEAGLSEWGGKCKKCGGKAVVVKQEVVGEGAEAAGKGEGKGKGAAENVVAGAGAADKGEGKGIPQVPIKTKNANYYKSLKGEGGTKSYVCRRCFDGASSTSHSWDAFCTEPRRYA